MKTITKTFDLYKFDELSKEAQDKAINDHINFEIETMDVNNPYYHCAEEMDRMQTPWFLGECIYEHHKDEIVETIRINKYLFFEDGELIPTDYYPKKFTFYWGDGLRQVLQGDTPANALNEAGYGGGAIAALDFYVSGDNTEYTWDNNIKGWVKEVKSNNEVG